MPSKNQRFVMTHTFNIALHVLAGTIGLVIGFLAIFYSKRVPKHRRYGKIFLYLLATVVSTGFLGWLFFRSNSFLLMLTMLAGYVGYAGYRNIRLREQRNTLIDMIVSMVTLAAGICYVVWLNNSNSNWSPSIVRPTLFALVLVTVYDLTKYFWLHRFIKKWWLYEHIYKMLSAHSALLSAFCGTVLPQFKPYSQIIPSVISLWMIVFFIVREIRSKVRARAQPLETLS
jgi:hypothetical protein